MPGEVGPVHGTPALPGDPAVEPVAARFVGAGLVVDVGQRVHGVAGGGLDCQGAVGEFARLVQPALVLAEEGEQRGVEPVAVVGRGRALDES